MLFKVDSKSKLTVGDKRNLEGLLMCHCQLLYTDHQERKCIGINPMIILNKGMTDGHVAHKLFIGGEWQEIIKGLNHIHNDDRTLGWEVGD